MIKPYKVSVDFDSTLSRLDVQYFIRDLCRKGIEVWVTTTRKPDEPDNHILYNAMAWTGIREERLVFTSGKLKWPYMQNFIWHLDDNPQELEEIKKNTVTAPIDSTKSDYMKRCMDLLEHDIIELFPTPLYSTFLPPDLSEVIDFLEKQPMSLDSDEKNYGRRSVNSYILESPECRNLKAFILDKIAYFAYHVLNYDYPAYRFGQSWISHKLPNQHHTLHTHPNSLISGVFYYGEADQDVSAIAFHKYIMGSSTPNIMGNTRNDNYTIYSSDRFFIPFEPGKLLLFSSHFQHSVPLNTSNKVRKSVAFNSVPVGGLGHEKNLTELKYIL